MITMFSPAQMAFCQAGQEGMSVMGGDRSQDPIINAKLRMAARALGRAQLVHAYGHCSMRLTEHSFLVCAPEPMGSIQVGEANQEVLIDDALPPGVLGEVRIHQAIYRERPEIQAVCRIMPPKLMTLSTLGIKPKPRHGLGAYFGESIPLWNDPRLLRDDAMASEMIAYMGDSPAIIMRGNGAVVVGQSIEEALTLAWFLEDAARVEVAVRSMGFKPEQGLLSPEEIVARQVRTGRVFERMWRHLTDGDPESSVIGC